MASWFDDEDGVFEVVMNDEEQFSIWPVGPAIPLGWRAVGKQGSRADCLAYIETVWTDMRPRSLREVMGKP